MDEKISWKTVDQYSAGFAHRVADAYFSKKDQITGADILSLCEVKQVNLFVIKELFGAWQQETQKYKSPFFNYEAPEVKNALQNFQTVLSNHIAVGRDHFIPILQKAVNQTLYLVLDPYDYYSDSLERCGKDKVRLDKLRNEIKYLKINRAPLERLAAKIEEEKTAPSANEAFALLDQILEEVGFTPEDVYPYINQFSTVLTLQLEKLYEKPVTPSLPKAEASSAQPAAKPSLNDRAQKEQKATVADNFQKIAQLREGLTINQKFMFTKMLFNGDFDLFTQTIAQIDGLETRDEAMRYINVHYAHWNHESEEYEEFIEMVNKRFA
ncbi:MAG: hypothetical protein AB7K37_00335 [Cyclobacteriaceae bacterium]